MSTTTQEKGPNHDQQRRVEESFTQEGEPDQQQRIKEESFTRERESSQQLRIEEQTFTLYPKLPPEMRLEIVNYAFLYLALLIPSTLYCSLSFVSFLF
jgi:hypothetical protein